MLILGYSEQIAVGLIKLISQVMAGVQECLITLAHRTISSCFHRVAGRTNGPEGLWRQVLKFNFHGCCHGT